MSATFQTATATPVSNDAYEAHTQVESLVESARRLGPLIQEHSGTTERARRVAKPVLDALAASGLQRMFTPRSLGGLEVDPVTCARVVEEVAAFDSAAAWSLQSGNVNAYWAARLSEKGVDEIYGANPSVMVAAAFHPPQMAKEVPGGFRVTGRSPLASMIHDSDWILFSAIIMDGDQPRMTPMGPALIAFLLPTHQVEIIDTWYTLGMRGTDSNDGATSDTFIPEHLAYGLAPEFEAGPHFQGPLYRFPAVPIISLFSAAVLMAAARGAIDELRALAQKKVAFGSMKTVGDRGVVQARVAEAEGTLRSARALFYQTMGQAWARTVSGQRNTLEDKADLMLASVHAVQRSVDVVDSMHRLAGTTGIYERSRLERYLRDAHTLRHHGFASESKLESIGQVFLGQQPEFPLLAF